MADTSETLFPGGISIHAVDVAHGIPAAGLNVQLRRIDPDPALIAQGCCSDTGLLVDPALDSERITRGLYEVRFGVSKYYRGRGIDIPNPSFVEDAVFCFGIDRVTEHFHLPFKFTPWGFSLFRGGA